MSDTNLYRLSAVAGIISGVSIIIGKLLIPLPNPQAGEIFDFFVSTFRSLCYSWFLPLATEGGWRTWGCFLHHPIHWPSYGREP